MDSQTKSAIKQLVLDLRHTLEDELTIVLRRYGIFTDRKWPLDAPPERLTDPADHEIWQRIVAVVRRGLREGRTLPESSQDYVRESAFTFLNRLVGLKCLEVRGIIDEVITTRDIYGGRSQAHRDYRDEHPREARAADDALPACLEEACRRVNDELIGYLFNPDDDHSLVWPRYAVLKSCIEKINALRPAQGEGLDEAVWREDEIIGWIYQFYNAEEKVAIRKRGKPKTPHDVAVINQFFTPRWICKFLVDNTLGRLWLEMHPDSPRVREKCDYLVPELLPSAEGEAERYALDPDSPINNPKAPHRREEKPITQIRLLDPACGTMHFGHYACEVFDAMYRDARDRDEVKIIDQRIPGAILEYNLYGVDIDRRAVQLAALSLFMKAKTMHPQARVQQVNLVVADATMPDSGVKKRFLARYAHDPRLQKAVAQVLDDMDQVAQVGSLLRVEERLRELLARAGHTAVVDGFDQQRQQELPGMEPEARQMGLAEVAAEEQAASWTPHTTLQEVRDDLRAFARAALQEHDVNAQLFATEADKAVRLLDVFVGAYDVVLMNPPYGVPTKLAQSYLKRSYPRSWNDLVTSFIERTVDLCSRGYLGAITSRTFLFLTRLQKFRDGILLPELRLVTLADLGFEVLDDAVVETAAFVATTESPTRQATAFFRLINTDGAEKQPYFERILEGTKAMEGANSVFVLNQDSFSGIPGTPFAYWAPPRIFSVFPAFPSFGPGYGDVRPGLTTRDNDRFVRHRWEIPLNSIGRGKKWVLFAKGGGYSPFYYDTNLLLLWENDGRELRRFITDMGDPETRFIANQQYYFREGLTYPRVTVKGFNVRYLPADHIFAEKGISIFFEESALIWPALAWLNSAVVQYFLLLMTASRSWEKGHVSSLPFPLATQNVKLDTLAKQAYQIKETWDFGNEISSRFKASWLLQLAQPEGKAYPNGLGSLVAVLENEALEPTRQALASQLDRILGIEKTADARLRAVQAQIDEKVYDLYDISPTDRALIEQELGERPPALVWPDMEGKSDREKRREHVRRFFSHFALQAVRGDSDGIVPLAGGASREPTLVDRVRAQLEAEFGPKVAYQFEQDAAEYLGRSLEEWLHRYFFHQFHAKLYKKRPILWHLTSDKKYFAVMVDYHHLTRDTLPKVQTLYLWPQMEAVRTRLAAAQAHEASLKEISDLEDELADLEDCNGRLEQVIQGTVKVDLPEWAVGPYRDGRPPYDPDLDDGVKVNLLPIQEAGLLPVKKVV